jgi:Carboxypeptidase regulatory-like domain
MSRVALAASLIATCLVGRTPAQTPTTRPRSAAGTIDGVVSDTSLAPLADATITIVGTDIRVVTGANGRFRLVAVPPGEYMVLARHIGYEPVTTKITVADLDTLRISLTLEAAVTSLDTVKVATHNVSPRLAEFYERRKIGPGQFMTEGQIEKLNKVAASDLFRNFMGIRLSADGRSAQSMRDFARKCPIMAIVDGFAKYTDFSQLPSPKEIAAIEFYAGPSEIPLQFKSTVGMSCGLILIWTRDGSSAVTPPPM